MGRFLLCRMYISGAIFSNYPRINQEVNRMDRKYERENDQKQDRSSSYQNNRDNKSTQNKNDRNTQSCKDN